MADKELKEVGYVSDRVDEKDVVETLKNPVVANTLAQLMSLVLRKPWMAYGSSPLVVRFVNRVLSPVWNRIILLASQAVVWGHAPMEVIWEVKDVVLPNGERVRSAVVIKDLVLVPPHKVRYLCDPATGEIQGFRYTKSLTEKYDVLDEKAFWVTHNGWMVGSPYGVPISAVTKPYEEMFRDILELLAVWVENQAEPPILGRAPNVEVDVGGRRIPAAEYMAQKLLELRSHGVTVIPVEFNQGGQPLWGVEVPLRFGEAGQIVGAVDTLLQLMRVSVFGISANVTTGHAQIVVPAEDLMASYVFAEIVDALNRGLVKWLVKLNWGDSEWCYLDPAEQGQVDVDLIRDLIRGSLQFVPDARSSIFSSVDWDSLFEMLGVPIRVAPKPQGAMSAVESLWQQATSAPSIPLASLLASMAPPPVEATGEGATEEASAAPAPPETGEAAEAGSPFEEGGPGA